ncbi:MAG: energy transducer TonB [Acidobacteria bacterium]|nr:energy transducer TonB [Acidobacteriota bacterium]
MSAVTHVVVFVFMMVAAALLPATGAIDSLQARLPNNIVWLPVQGPGGGGGGGGNKSPDPPQRAELTGKQKITVPVQKPVALENPKPKDEPPPEQNLVIPAQTLASAEQTLPGVLEGLPAPPGGSQGIGTGGGAGSGNGTGIGEGTGSGLGPGWGGGTGGGAYRPGNGVSIPRVLREVKPQYTSDAMRAKVQGIVWLECIVLPDGSVGEVTVIKSLDPVFGLDQEAVKAAKQWKFVPGTRNGQPVPVIVTIELTFTLR